MSIIIRINLLTIMAVGGRQNGYSRGGRGMDLGGYDICDSRSSLMSSELESSSCFDSDDGSTSRWVSQDTITNHSQTGTLCAVWLRLEFDSNKVLLKSWHIGTVVLLIKVSWTKIFDTGKSLSMFSNGKKDWQICPDLICYQFNIKMTWLLLLCYMN